MGMKQEFQKKEKIRQAASDGIKGLPSLLPLLPVKSRQPESG